MATLNEIMAQIEALRAEAAEIRRRDLPGVIKTIHEIMDEYGITFADLDDKPKRGRRPGQTMQLAPDQKEPRPPMFRNPESGATWSGRGRKPQWLTGQDQERFRVQ